MLVCGLSFFSSVGSTVLHLFYIQTNLATTQSSAVFRPLDKIINSNPFDRMLYQCPSLLVKDLAADINECIRYSLAEPTIPIPSHTASSTVSPSAFISTMTGKLAACEELGLRPCAVFGNLPGFYVLFNTSSPDMVRDLHAACFSSVFKSYTPLDTENGTLIRLLPAYSVYYYESKKLPSADAPRPASVIAVIPSPSIARPLSDVVPLVQYYLLALPDAVVTSDGIKRMTGFRRLIQFVVSYADRRIGLKGPKIARRVMLDPANQQELSQVSGFLLQSSGDVCPHCQRDCVIIPEPAGKGSQLTCSRCHVFVPESLG